jgi:hypothetical protein
MDKLSLNLVEDGTDDSREFELTIGKLGISWSYK